MQWHMQWRMQCAYSALAATVLPWQQQCSGTTVLPWLSWWHNSAALAGGYLFCGPYIYTHILFDFEKIRTFIYSLIYLIIHVFIYLFIYDDLFLSHRIERDKTSKIEEFRNLSQSATGHTP